MKRGAPECSSRIRPSPPSSRPQCPPFPSSCLVQRLSCILRPRWTLQEPRVRRSGARPPFLPGAHEAASCQVVAAGRVGGWHGWAGCRVLRGSRECTWAMGQSLRDRGDEEEGEGGGDGPGAGGRRQHEWSRREHGSPSPRARKPLPSQLPTLPPLFPFGPFASKLPRPVSRTLSCSCGHTLLLARASLSLAPAPACSPRTLSRLPPPLPSPSTLPRSVSPSPPRKPHDPLLTHLQHAIASF